jgi:hypothetical protein
MGGEKKDETPLQKKKKEQPKNIG